MLRNESPNTHWYPALDRGSAVFERTASHRCPNLAVEEINRAGGVLGRQVKAIPGNGRSSSRIFCAEAERLINKENVVSLFGCWTSASRRQVRPVVEDADSLLWYPVQYEGLEQ